MSAIAITLKQWKAAGLSYTKYENDKKSGKLKTFPERASKGAPINILVDSIKDEKKKSAILKKIPSLQKDRAFQMLLDLIKPDDKALTFYSSYQLEDGRRFENIENGDKYIREYTANAQVLNALVELKKKQETATKALGGKIVGFFNIAAEALISIKEETGHTLPCMNKKGEPNGTLVKRKFDNYIHNGYESLISKHFCNDRTRKVTSQIERLIMSIYTMKNKPFAADVHLVYLSFILGKTQIADSKTGELFNPKDFYKDGKPIEISESTVWRYLNMPHNRAVVDSRRNSSHSFNNMHRPHHHRTAPKFSFSKISLDDRDLPRKLKDGNRLKAYYAYDVASGCVVGYSYSRSKDDELFVSCLRNMFRFIENNNLPMPMEAEVEHHLVSKYFEDLEVIFPYLRICNAGNSQEKRAEHFNRAKKYQNEKKTQTGIGRWWAKSEAFRVDSDKIDDQFIEKTYTIERIVADDEASIKVYNNSLHPKQNLYPGKTRWEVLMENLNPDAPKVSKAVLYKSIGEKTETSIVRNQYVRVQNARYVLPDIEVLSKLSPNSYEVIAFWLRDAFGEIKEVFIYQNEKFICRAEKLNKYNESKAESKWDDYTAYLDQAKYVASFDKFVKEGKKQLASPEILENMEFHQEPKIIDTPFHQEETPQDLMDDFDPNEYANKALNDI